MRPWIGKWKSHFRQMKEGCKKKKKKRRQGKKNLSGRKRCQDKKCKCHSNLFFPPSVLMATLNIYSLFHPPPRPKQCQHVSDDDMATLSVDFCTTMRQVFHVCSASLRCFYSKATMPCSETGSCRPRLPSTPSQSNLSQAYCDRR